MIRRFALRASRPLAGAIVLAALSLPAGAAAMGFEFSSQDRPAGAPGAAPRPAVSGVPAMRGPTGPRRPAVVPHYGGRGTQFGGPQPGWGPAPGFGGYRRPAAGYPGYRGHAFVRGRHYVRRGGVLLPLIGLGALGAIYVGSRPYPPYAYVDGVVGPQCSGPTEDGVCELRMTEVPLESGGAELQCVAYCPQ
jgi:hypothetical protein